MSSGLLENKTKALSSAFAGATHLLAEDIIAFKPDIASMVLVPLEDEVAARVEMSTRSKRAFRVKTQDSGRSSERE